MLSLRSLTRSNVPPYTTTVQRLHTSILLQDSSGSSSDSDKKSKKKPSHPKSVVTEEQKLQSQMETTSRLNSLLDTMIKQEPKISKTLNLSMPTKKPKAQPELEKKTYEQSLIGAAKEVASSLGGDVPKTESDLLDKLLSTEKTKSGTEAPKGEPLSLSDLIAGMKIDRTPEQRPAPQQTMQRSFQAQNVAQKFESMKFRQTDRRSSESQDRRGLAKADSLYKTNPLKLFSQSEKPENSADIPRLTTWQILEQKEFNLALTHPPENIFQEMIQWTEQGKLWKFPIDNEQGMEEEQSVHFSEHVFMERHLQDWCPKRGPIRHFMELVCVGLSKNPYMTVKEKKEHIAWYREYFGTKQELLKETGAIEEEIPLEAKRVEA